MRIKLAQVKMLFLTHNMIPSAKLKSWQVINSLQGLLQGLKKFVALQFMLV